jgi:predicted nuclease of predicted toxin-antitoxin system
LSLPPIYLDDCAYDKVLVRHLQDAGHQVITPPEVGLSGAEDPEHFQRAKKEGWVLLTKNPRDFAELHEADRGHAGILAVCQDNDPSRDMTYADVVQAIANLLAAGVTLTGECHILNAWRY